MRVLRVGLNEPNDVHCRTKTHGDCNCPMALAYWGTKVFEYDLPDYDVPSGFIHLHLGRHGLPWCGLGCPYWPVGNKQVSLAQEMPRQFQSPEQVQNQPFEMNGMWCIIWNGQYMVWDDTSQQWTPYRGN